MSRDSRDSPILIGVVGVTGSGKSHFIKRVTGNESIGVGDGLESETTMVEQYPLTYNGRKYVFIDSPGFNDSELDDREVFTRLSNWLVTTYRAGQLLNGLIYLVSVLENRQKGSEIRNLKMFKKLCGAKNFKNIVLGLTHCDQETEKIIQKRSKELVENPLWWGDMVERGSVVRNIPFEPQGPEAYREILDHFTPLGKMTAQVQSEVVDKGISIENTEAASTILYYKELVVLREQEANDIQEMKKSFETRKMKAAVNSQNYQDELLMEHKQANRKLEKQRAAQVLRLQKQEEVVRQEHTRLEEIERKEEEKRSRELRSLEEKMRQTKIAEDRLKLQQEEAAKLKQHALKLRAFQNYQVSGFNAFKKWNQNGGVKHGEISGHDMLGNFCNACLMPAFPKPGQVYTCEKCYRGKDSPLRGIEGGEKTLMICASCRAKGHSCLDKSHTLLAEAIPVKTDLSMCSRTGSETELSCHKCMKRIQESHYLHCCTCAADDFDLCITCWGKGGSCENLSHTLYILSWSPSRFRD